MIQESITGNENIIKYDKRFFSAVVLVQEINHLKG